jgi:hypothetical protein
MRTLSILVFVAGLLLYETGMFCEYVLRSLDGAHSLILIVSMARS